MDKTPTHNSVSSPRVGMLATLRNRRAIVSAVEPYDGVDGRLHLVHLEYIDPDGVPTDTVVWERESGAKLLEPIALPNVSTHAPMPAAEFDALVRATRWTALTPYLAGKDAPAQVQTPIAAPLFGAVQVEDFQLVPLLKALQMPRITLMLADDVGLGKTIEAGLVLTELLLRRRIRRVLIMCPAALRTQWQQEMRDKFSLSFEVIDREETHAIQKRLGFDANPWRTYPRIITSYYYLRQPDVLEQFLATCRNQPTTAAQLPWDLLIVDEAHNLTPANFGEDSDLAKLLGHISPYFEHKLFLTATPHNGHTRSFTGLLEKLDPVRFTQTSELTEAGRRRIEEVVVRRLKRDINERDRRAGRTPRFSERIPEPLPLFFSREEQLLGQAFQHFRTAVRKLIAQAQRSEQLAGSFALEVLNKRLLSSPYTFAHSWYRFKEGMAQVDTAEAAEVSAARRAVEEDLDDDLEVEGRIQHAAKTTGAWLKPLAPHLTVEMGAIDRALRLLELVEADPLPNPVEDARWDRLLKLIQDRLRDGQRWVDDERLIIFTEYKTTLDYLARRLQATFKDAGAIRVLFGGMPDVERESIKQAFNDPADPVRILVATDAASEGLNLQETARFVLHYDIPFNPARLDQRNGRLDRHGQARDVVVFHFTSEDDADLRFLAHVVNKVNTIREELGSMGEVFDAAFERRFMYDQDTDSILADLDRAVEARRGRSQIPQAEPAGRSAAEEEALAWLTREIDLSPQTLRDTLEQALGFDLGLPRFEPVNGRVRLQMPLPPRWEPLIDSSLRLKGAGEQRGALPALTFDPHYFIQMRNGRPVFRSSKDTVMLHLGHPMFQRALAMFARARFPGSDGASATRWTVRYGQVPPRADALVLLTLEELAVNELRETFHHWVRTLRLPVIGGELGEPLPHVPPAADRPTARTPDREAIATAQQIWDDVELDVRDFLKRVAETVTREIKQRLADGGKQAVQEEKERFRHRVREVEQAMKENSLNRLEREWRAIEAERQTLRLAPALLAEVQVEQAERIREIERRQADLEEELNRRRHHYEALLESLKREEKRVIEQLLPRRYQLRGAVQVFPVTVEIRLPEVSR